MNTYEEVWQPSEQRRIQPGNLLERFSVASGTFCLAAPFAVIIIY
jgi:hypothetical protein